MKYLSKNGCLFYFDRSLYSWRICEPTMLFLLGFESITVFDNSPSDTIRISKYAYHSYDGSVSLYKDFSIFDRIYGFLSLLGEVEDNEIYSDFKCNGIKLLLNEFTGMSTDRTIPIIFKNDINTLSVDLSSKMNRISDISYSKYSINDLRAQKISDILTDANYTNPDYKSTDLYDTSNITDTTVLSLLNAYNNKLISLHEERKFNNNIYRLIDYRSIYSYALGILYGCRCLGYDSKSIWRLDPQFWYNGIYTNLVSTAWKIFRFHYIDQPYLSDDDKEKYCNIVLNKLWNFTNDENSDVQLRHDEINVASVAIEDDNPSIRSIIYSYNNDNQEYIPLYISDTDLNTWIPADNSIIVKTYDNNVNLYIPERDLIDPNDKYLLRYIGTTPVKLFPAYRYKFINDNPNEYSYLKDYYFTTAGNLGWVKYNKNDFNSDQHKSLSIYPIPLDQLPGTFTPYLDSQTQTLVACYTCELYDNDLHFKNLYGFSNDVTFGTGCSNIIPNSDSSFYYLNNEINNERYKSITLSGAYPYRVYDLDNLIYVVKGHSATEDEIWDGESVNPPSYISMYTYGYSKKPSTELSVYTEVENNISVSNIRYYFNNGLVYYWEKINPTQGWQEYSISDPLPNNNFFLLDTVTLYKNIEKQYTNISAYSNEIKIENNIIKPKPNPSDKFIYINNEFVSLNILHDTQGITEYACSIIYEDDFGNPLLDIHGNPAVWYDEYKNKYWNGLLSTPAWQDGKPVLNGLLMYDSVLHVITSVVDNEYSHTITIGDNVISYSEFYNHSNYGIIRETVKVYSDLTGMIDCYYDSYSDEYCIPNITNQWVTRSDIVNLGYRFVDGTGTLYNGDTEIEVIVDNDNVD